MSSCFFRNCQTREFILTYGFLFFNIYIKLFLFLSIINAIKAIYVFANHIIFIFTYQKSNRSIASICF